MSSLGIGPGLERGVGIAGNALMRALEMRQKKQQFDQEMFFRKAWLRAQTGLGPRYEDVDKLNAVESASAPASSSPLSPAEALVSPLVPPQGSGGAGLYTPPQTGRPELP